MNDVLKDILKQLQGMEIKRIDFRECEIDIEFTPMQFVELFKKHADDWDLDVYVNANATKGDFSYLTYRDGNMIFQAYIQNIATADNIAKRYGVERKYHELS